MKRLIAVLALAAGVVSAGEITIDFTVDIKDDGVSTDAYTMSLGSNFTAIIDAEYPGTASNKASELIGRVVDNVKVKATQAKRDAVEAEYQAYIQNLDVDPSE